MYSKLTKGLAVFAILMLIFSAVGDRAVFAGDKNPTAMETKNETTASKPSVFKPRVTFVEIGAARCIPCKAMQPIMKEVAETYKGQVVVLFHDVWTPQGRIDARNIIFALFLLRYSWISTERNTTGMKGISPRKALWRF